MVITPGKKELGPAFKGNQMMIAEALEVNYETFFFRILCPSMIFIAALESKGEVDFHGINVCIKKNVVNISKEKTTKHQVVFTPLPLVIEPSFGIGRIDHTVSLSTPTTRDQAKTEAQI
ncbi:hypothetical protein TIFTF001_006416 [Ficus carica]|uniref:Uncharacterized protein n=1 Tax=Ficus carica TaxID=3494 RepID=A0AA87ZP82_FICCA|nr:hypothetical protein TIFTF001_006416 [Ficus carica]